MANANSFIMRNKKHIPVIILLLFLLSTVVTAFHYHHDDNSTHHDCPLCIAGSHFSPGTFNKVTLEFVEECVVISTIENIQSYIQPYSSLLSSRAPPA
ncbi:MAG: hypothetical protein C0402_12155 [Thermodesulfovibrio sp.]|nr:hypothetical protein [Thermodesulfovibrio sp.]